MPYLSYHATSIRLPRDLLLWLRKQAGKSRRSLTQEIVATLYRGKESMEREQFLLGKVDDAP